MLLFNLPTFPYKLIMTRCCEAQSTKEKTKPAITLVVNAVHTTFDSFVLEPDRHENYDTLKMFRFLYLCTLYLNVFLTHTHLLMTSEDILPTSTDFFKKPSLCFISLLSGPSQCSFTAASTFFRTSFVFKEKRVSK